MGTFVLVLKVVCQVFIQVIMWITLSKFCLHYLKCAKFPRLTRCIGLVLVVLLTLVVLVELTIGRAARSHSVRETQKTSTKNSSLLYECELSYLQLDLSLIKFSINYLEREIEPWQRQFNQQADQDDNDKIQDCQGELDSFRLARIDYNSSIDELLANTKLDTNLPFVFFINGFNTFAPYDEINATWMYDVARSFARRQIDDHLNKPEKRSTNDQCGILSRIHRFLARATNFRSSNENDPDEEDDQKKVPIPFADGRNVVFLTWSIPDLFASNLFSMIPAYYKTVANYDLIVDYVAKTIIKFIKLIEQNNEFKTTEDRSKYYSQFEFYGHSLGSHIFSDAISRVVSDLAMLASQQTSQQGLDSRVITKSTQSQTQFDWTRTKSIKFGKLMGLDPASPCFVSLEYGISSSKVSEAVNEVVVLHSNAGFAGIPNERANLEIVLNGGTFQPGCVWYDFTCSHVRSTDILSYIDDECQMVAYKCTSYNHFKQGACEACLDSTLLKGIGGSNSNNSRDRNCVLVNLPEQHRDKPQVLAYADQMSNKTRQLAEAAATKSVISTKLEQFKQLKSIELGRQNSKLGVIKSIESNETTKDISDGSEAKTKKTYFHYVNTSANFRFGRKSHCLQHYQLRLLIYNEDLHLREKCKLSSFYLKSSDEIKVKMYYEDVDDDRLVKQSPASSKNLASRVLDRRPKLQSANSSQGQPVGQKLVPKMFQDNDDPRIMSNQIKLGAIVRDIFHTALVNFEAGPKLFVGAQLDNLDLVSLGECYKRENATSGPKFVLDIAFMSHTNQKIRYAYSSVLCGQMNLSTVVKEPSLSSNETVNNKDNKDPSPLPSNLNNSRQTIPDGDDLMLNLCKQSELKNVSAEIDKLLDQIKLHLLDETWKVSLLNSLFSLFTEWEPF